MNFKRILSIFVTIMMVLSAFSVSFADTSTESTSDTASTVVFTDVTEHWGKAAIEKWAGYGIINGFEGLFRPDDSITRGEMAVILDNLMDYQEVAANTFTDLKAGQFYTDAVLKANIAGIIKGDGTTVRPTDKITKEEAAIMLSRAFAVEPANNTKAFQDASSVSEWAKSAVFGMEAKGYVSGFNGYFNPKASITRAEAVTMINNIVKAYYTTAGTYSSNVDGTAVIKVSGVTLKGVTVSGNLIIAEGVAKGEATLDSVTVKGETVIRGGGENSIHIVGNSSITKITIEKVGDKLRVVIEDGITVSNVEVAVGEEIIITGSVGTVEVAAPDAIIYATDAEIKNLTIAGEDAKIVVGAQSVIDNVTVSGTANNAAIETQTGAVVKTVTASAEVTVSGTGKVTTVTLNEGANGSSVTTPNTATTVGSGVTGVTGGGGTAIPAGSTGTNNSTGTGSNVTETTTTGGGGGGGTGGTPSLAIGTLTFDDNAVLINGSPVTKDGSGRYQIDKDWTTATDLSVTAVGSGFTPTGTYSMEVKIAVNGTTRATFTQSVLGSQLNTTRNINEGNVSGDVIQNGLLNTMFTLWDSSNKTVGDTIRVDIGISGGSTLKTLNFIVVN